MHNLNPVAKLQHDLKGQLRRQEIIFQLIFRTIRLEGQKALPESQTQAPILTTDEMQELIIEMEKSQTSFHEQWGQLKKILAHTRSAHEEIL